MAALSRENKDLKSLDGEVWADIPGYDGIFQASNLGRVKSLGRLYYHSYKKKELYTPEKILSQMITNFGYCRCQLSYEGKKEKWFVHRLIGMAFIDNKENKPQINHKNGARTDNRVENLEWVTNSENNKHAYDELGRVRSKAFLGRFGKLHHASKPVHCQTLDIVFESARMAARELGLSQGSISHVCNGERTSIDGLYFRYV